MSTEDHSPEPEETVVPPARDDIRQADPSVSGDSLECDSDTDTTRPDDCTLDDDGTLIAPITATGGSVPPTESPANPENVTWVEPGKPSESTSSDDPETPQQNRFKLVNNFARGGLGNIWLAFDDRIRREVAFKELLPKALKSTISVSRFLEEAQITGQLEHPGIVPIYELGTQKNGTPYYTMKLVRGETFDAAIKACHALPRHSAEWNRSFNRLLRNFIDICNTLAFAHDHHVIHRDLKPQNVMLGQFGETLVLDWGLAKVIKCDAQATTTPWYNPANPTAANDQQHASEPDNTGVTDSESTAGSPTHSEHADVTVDADIKANPAQTKSVNDHLSSSGILRREVSVNERTSGTETMDGSVLGTPAYMAPEQARGEHDSLDARADIYALGAILYRLLTNTTPLGKGTVRQILSRARECEIRSPREHDASIPRALEAICLKAMQKDPEDRYQSALALKDDVEAWLSDEPVSAWPDPFLLRLRRWIRRHQTLVLSGAAVVITATVLPVVITSVRLNQLTDSVEERFRNANVAIAENDYQTAASLLDEAAGLLANEPDLGDLASQVERKRSSVAAIVASNDLKREQQRRAESDAARRVAEVNFQRAERERRRANQNFIIASAQRLVAESEAVRALHPRLSLLLSVEAVEISRRRQEAIVPEALQNLHEVAASFGGTGLFGHEDQIRDSAISHDQRWLLTGSKDRTARLWDLTASNPQQKSIRLTGHEGAVNCVALPSGNRWAVTAGDDADVVVWDLMAADIGNAPVVLRGHSLPVTCMETSADGQWLVTSGVDADIRLWNLTASDIANSVRVLKGHTDTVNQLCFSPDGNRLVSAGETGVIRVWSIKSETTRSPASNDPSVPEQQQLSRHTSGVLSLAVSPSGRWLVSGDAQGSVWLWDLNDQQLATAYPLAGHRRAVTEVAFSSTTVASPSDVIPNDLLATAGTDGNVIVWRLTDKEPEKLAEFLDHDGAVNDLAWTSKGQTLVTAGDDRTVRMYRSRPDGQFDDPSSASTLRAHEDAVWTLATQGDHLVSGALDGALQLWDLSRDEPGMTPDALRHHDRSIQKLVASADGMNFLSLSSDRDRSWSLWQRSTGGRFRHADTSSTDGTSGRADAVAWNSQTSMAAVAEAGGSITLLKVSDSGLTSTKIRISEIRIRSLAFSADGKHLLAAGEDGRIAFLEVGALNDGAVVEASATSPEDSDLMVIKGSPDSREYAAGSEDGGILVGRLGSKPHWLPGSHRNTVNDLAYSPDGNYLASVSDDHSVRIWKRSPDGRFGESPQVLVRHEDRIRGLDISQNSRLLLTVSDDAQAIVWPLDSDDPSAQARILVGHDSAIHSGRLSDDGRWALTGSDDGTVRLWDLASSNPSASSVVLNHFDEPVRAIELIHDSREVLVGTRKGDLFVWPLESEALLHGIRETAGRSLSPAEAQQFRTNFQELDPPVTAGQ